MATTSFTEPSHPEASNSDNAPTRRQFLVSSAAVGAGLTVGLSAHRSADAASRSGGTGGPFHGYLHIAPDNAITIYSAHLEMGQGSYTGIATLVAEELDADWAQIRVEGASGNSALYGNLAWGGKSQGTGGSSAMVSSFDRYRRAGAVARTMLVAAAADAWRVPVGEIRVQCSVLSHSSGRSATFGQFADAASRQPVPNDVALKSAVNWTLIGSDQLRRVDSAAKSSGRQQFTFDVRLPGMLTAVIAHPPLFGATLKSLDPAKAKAVRGVVDVVAISRGVVVIAESTWAALKGRDALVLNWDHSAAEKRGSLELLADFRRRLERPGEHVAMTRGDTTARLEGAAKIIEATYVFPYLAHAAMEPLAAVVARSGDRIEVWGGHQSPDHYQSVAARIADVPRDNVRLHVMPTGGSFGRRGVPDADIIVEAVETAKAFGWKAPVKLMWTREDDMRGGRYRPMMVHKVRVGVAADGAIAGWHHRIIGQSLLQGGPFEGGIQGGVDPTSVEGAADMPYAIADLHIEVTNARSGIPVLWWRSVGHTHTAFVVETMIDEIAAAAGKDPVALRRTLLHDHPRHRAVLDLVAEKAGWSSPLPARRGRGVALHKSFSTLVAQVAEVSVEGDGAIKVERVVCAVDCGIAINPDQVRAQMEGGIGFGLGAILHEEVTLTEGRIDAGNYDLYMPLRIGEMPTVEVHIIASQDRPTGVGEPGVPPIGPAVANAVAAVTGKRIRLLPFTRGLQV